MKNKKCHKCKWIKSLLCVNCIWCYFTFKDKSKLKDYFEKDK